MHRLLVAALALTAACDRKQPREGTPPAPVPTAAAEAAAPACKLGDVPLRRPAPTRLVAIGDLHGDLAALRAALRTAGAIDAADAWIGGALVVVQTGDQLDRGDDEQAIYDFLRALEPKAAAAGGAMITLIGNHELMNGAGDFRYVTPGGMHDFDDVAGLDTTKWSAVPARARARFAALAPGGIYAKWIAQHAVVAIVGDTVFSHAGVTADFATHLEEINVSSRCWLDGQAGGPQQPPELVTAEESPVWTRAYGGETADCAALSATLATLGAKRMVVGHTVQREINSLCDGALWRIDVGLAKNYNGPIQVLEVAPTPRVLTGSR